MAYPPVVFLMGPTASGKTDMAVALAQALPLDVVSVDSALVYRTMDVGTAKPAPEVLARTPHRLVDIVDPAQGYSAARFRRDALAAIADSHGNGRIPLLAGGTGLYFRALEQGLAGLPAADAATRRRLAAVRRESGGAALHERLRAVDPEAAARIHPNDPQRVQRALEVYEMTGRSITELRREQAARALPHPVLKLVLMPTDRDALRERIARRLEAMLAADLVAEVRRLRARPDIRRDLPAMRAVGYRQVWDYLEGELSYAEMKARLGFATNQLAKRQMTWFRAEQAAVFLDPFAPGATAKALGTVRAFLAAHGHGIGG